MNTVIISESLYEELVEYFDGKADANFDNGLIPNEEMVLLTQLTNEFDKYNGTTIKQD